MKTKKGERQVRDYIFNLKQRNDKNSRINFASITNYIKLLSIKGLNLGMPYIRKIEDDLWELRPLKNRILFYVNNNKEFVLLHMFTKKTNKTPENEKQKARNEIRNYIAMENNNE